MALEVGGSNPLVHPEHLSRKIFNRLSMVLDTVIKPDNLDTLIKFELLRV